MIYLVLNTDIIVGPAGLSDQRIRQALFGVGFTESAAGLHAPDGTPLPALPATEPIAELILADGYALLPAVVQPDNPPAGEIVTGHTTTVAGGVVTVAPVYGPAPVAPAPDINTVRAAKQVEITTKAQAILAPMRVQYCDEEMATWDQQAVEAAAYTASDAAATPLLSVIAGKRGMDVATLAAHVLANEAAWKAFSGSIIGQRLAYQDKLDAITDQTTDPVEAIQDITVAYTTS